MGVNKKGKYKSSRRQFGKAAGKHSLSYRKKQKTFLLKRNERVRWYRDNRGFHCTPYQIIRRQSRGTIKIVVKRLPYLRDSGYKMITVGSKPLNFKCVKKNDMSGYRILNLDLLQDNISAVTAHTALCSKVRQLVLDGKTPIEFKTEVNKKGLFSVLMIECAGCRQQFPLKNSQKQENGLYDINVRAVWGSVASGGGASKLNETLSAMNIPPMRDSLFSSIEDNIGDWWGELLKQEMLKAGAEERRLAIERGQFHENVPAIKVICDGGWSKRTHKHTYNASGGVAVIFGAATKKLLYIGVRNKQCIICKRAENSNIQPNKHNCFSNWKKSSQSMEADIILSGFLEAESSHGVRYMEIIGDGDSSVFPQLQEHVPVWGRDIQKLECANHTCKCVRTNLEKLVLEKPHYKGKEKLTKLIRARLTTAIRCAIKMRSADKNAKQLRHDILNSIYHVLGFHDNCSNFCKKRSKDSSTDIMDDNEDTNTTDESFDDIFEQQVQLWNMPSNKDMQSSRDGYSNVYCISELKELIQDVQIILNRVADKCDRLIGNFTTNLAESWMAIRAKFDGGKVINRCGRGSWATRCYGGALRKNLGSAWSPLTFQNVTNTQAGTYFYNNARRQVQKLRASAKYHSKPESRCLRAKRKLQQDQESKSKTAKMHYGSNLDDSPDVSNNQLTQLCNSFLETQLQKTIPEITLIEKNTVNQHQSDLWKKERRIRLTSSNFGKVIQRRSTNVSTCIVKDMLYSKFKGNIYTIRGLAQEANTIIEYQNKKPGVKVDKTGLKISHNFPFLASSTDGIITEGDSTGLLEIKNFLQTNNYLIKEAAVKIPTFCLKLKKDKLTLKKNNAVYYQIQGQLNIFEKEWCDFVLRRTNPYDMFIERVHRDKDLWKNIMIPKLESFYMKFILPELALPRFGTYTGIRKPQSPWYDIDVVSHLTEHQKPLKTVLPHSHSCKTPSSHKPDQQQTYSPPNPTVSQKTQLPETRRSRRKTTTKFVGRKILHQWIIDERAGQLKWYKGRVLQVLKGRDGTPAAVYEVLYEGEDEPHEVDNLAGDHENGSLKFIDI